MSDRSTSAIRRAIEQVNQAQRLQPFSQDEVAELGEVMLWRILVEPYIPPQSGVIARPQAVDRAERILSKVGRVLQIGCFCYQSTTTSGLNLSTANPKAEVGKHYLYEMYAGQEVSLRSGHVLRLLTETELLMYIKNPDLIAGYAE